MSISKLAIFTYLLLISLTASAGMNQQLQDELDLIEGEAQNMRVYPPQKKSNKSATLSKIDSNKRASGILDIESEFRDEEIKLNRSAPIRKKKINSSSDDQGLDPDQDIDEI